MNSCPRLCSGASDTILCRCLNVTEGEVVTAITTLGLRTVKDVRRVTEAGDGCTCCHQRIRECLAQHQETASPLSVAG